MIRIYEHLLAILLSCMVVFLACASVPDRMEDLDEIRYKANLFDRLHTISDKYTIMSVTMINNHLVVIYFDKGKETIRRASVRLSSQSTSTDI